MHPLCRCLFSSGSVWASIASYHLYWHLLPYQSHLSGSTQLLRGCLSRYTGFGSEARAHLYSRDLEHLALTWAVDLLADRSALPARPAHTKCCTSSGVTHPRHALTEPFKSPVGAPATSPPQQIGSQELTGPDRPLAAAQASLSTGDSAAGNSFWYARSMHGAFGVTNALWRSQESTALRNKSLTWISWA